MSAIDQGVVTPETILDGSRFVRACLRKPVDRTPVWFLRQAGRYMQEYRDVRKHHTLVEICKDPKLAAEVTITAAEKLGVDAAIIFADLLLPLEPMGLDFEFQAGEGPVVHRPVRTAEDVRALRTDRASELGYVARAIEKGEPYGFMKVLIDAETKLILGAAILGTGGDEVVHSILDVMYAKAPYTLIQRAVHIHPTVSELIPTMLEDLKPL